MKGRAFTFFTTLVVAVVVLNHSSCIATDARWDFSGTFYQKDGVGSSQPGAVVGAIITGYMTAGNIDNSPTYSYTDWRGGTTTVIYCYGYLNYTLSSGGVSTSYNEYLSETTMSVGGGSEVFDFWGGANTHWFSMSTGGLGTYEPPTVQGFLSGIGPEGYASIMLGDGSWSNGVGGYVSMTQTITAPEPSMGLLGSMTTVGIYFAGKRLRRSRPKAQVVQIT